MSIASCAWALQCVGHEVCIGFPPSGGGRITIGDLEDSVRGSGLTAASYGDAMPMSVFPGDYPELVPTMAESERLVAELGLTASDRDHWDTFYHFMLFFVHTYHPPNPREDVEELIAFARDWKPDLVIWDHWFPCGAVAARVCGAAHARILHAPDYSGWVMERRADRGVRQQSCPDPLADAIRPLAERHGVEVDEELLLGQWTIDPMPETMRITTSVPRLPVRYVPYNGAVSLPRWLAEPPKRPRVAISFGLSGRNFQNGDWGRTAKLMEALSDMDVEVIATLNEQQLGDVPGGVPDNVQAFDFLPLNHLLPTCSAVIHHGTPATLSVAAAKGVPQLICDTDERSRFVGKVTDSGVEWELIGERHFTAGMAARHVAEHGAGARLNHQTQSAADMRARLVEVLEKPSFHEGAQALRRTWLATPSVIDLVPALEAKTVQFRNGEMR